MCLLFSRAGIDLVAVKARNFAVFILALGNLEISECAAVMRPADNTRRARAEPELRRAHFADSQLCSRDRERTARFG